MKNFNPFLFYSGQLQELLTKAAKQKNPALWLYKNKARTLLFMLEALTRIHNKAFDEKVFSKWNKRFKKLEDLFGDIDEYLVLEKDLRNNKKVAPAALKFFLVNAGHYLTRCNKRLEAKDWLNKKMISFDNEIREFDVLYNKEFSEAVTRVLNDELEAILDYVAKQKYRLKDIEQVHEIRRKVRWLSIYAQAFRGLIQLKKSTARPPSKISYFTKEILNSPYNKVETKPKNADVIQFDRDSFYALSWLINELGIFKDKGLLIEHLANAIYVSEKTTPAKAKEKAIKSLGFSKQIESEILSQASDTIKTVLLKDKIPSRLIIG